MKKFQPIWAFILVSLNLISKSRTKMIEIKDLNLNFEEDLRLSGVSTHSKVVMCVTDPFMMYNGDMSVEQIPMDLCTHVIVETRFLKSIVWHFKDLNKSPTPLHVKGFNKRILKHRESVNPNCKLLLSFNSYKGDYGDQMFEIMSGSDAHRSKFYNNTITFLRKYKYQGVNVEISPYSRIIGIGKIKMFEFIKSFHMELKSSNLSLTLTIHEQLEQMQNVLIWTELDAFFDYLILRFHAWGATESYGIYPIISLRGAAISVENYVRIALEGNLASEQLIVGIPTFFPEYKRISENSLPEIGERYNSEPETLSYRDVCIAALSNELTRKYYYDELTESTFLSQNATLISFFGPLVASRHGKYILQRGIGGIVIWGLQTEDYDGNFCDPAKNITFSIIRTFNYVFSKGIDTPQSIGFVESNLFLTTICLVVVVLLTASGLIYRLRNSKTHTNKSTDILTQTEVEEFYAGTGSLLSMELQEFYERTEDFSINACTAYDMSIEVEDYTIHANEILGYGAYGMVFKGEINQNTVAVKTINISPVTKQCIKSFLDEIRLMSYIGNHTHILALVGANTSDLHKGKVLAFVEFCEHGSLKGVLRGCKNDFKNLFADKESFTSGRKLEIQNLQQVGVLNVSSTDLILWASQISQGMEFLRLKNVIHGDLATRNILVKSRNCIKISDFGLSRKIYTYCIYKKQNQEPLPWRWMAIETLRDLEFSYKSDMWAFGVTLWEIFTLANLPYEEMPWTNNFVNQLIEGVRLQEPKYSTNEIYDKMLKCWAQNPADRPTFVEMSEFLLTLLRKISYNELT